MSTEHLRHKPLSELDRDRQLVIACPSFKSRVNLSRIVRLAGCSGVARIIVEGTARIDQKIARDAADHVELERRRSLAPVLKKMGDEGARIVGLEQTNDSLNLYQYQFCRNTVLVIGHERLGITDEVLAVCQETIEIPVYGMPYSYNVVTATTMAVYEYCKQFPRG